MFQAILHVGDMAYDMAEENGKRGDDFMEQIEPIASTVPYMTCPGFYGFFSRTSGFRSLKSIFKNYFIGCLHSKDVYKKIHTSLYTAA